MTGLIAEALLIMYFICNGLKVKHKWLLHFSVIDSLGARSDKNIRCGAFLSFDAVCANKKSKQVVGILSLIRPKSSETRCRRPPLFHLLMAIIPNT